MCRASFSRYGSLPIDLSSDVIEESSTAGAVLGWMARRYALPTRTVSYDLDQRALASIEPGSVVSVSDAQVGMVAQIAIVESVRYSAIGSVVVGIRTVEDPARDRL